MKLSEVTSKSFSEVPKIIKKDLRPIFISSNWDGPLTGLIEVHGEKCWFSCKEHRRTKRRRYWLVKLIEEQITAIETRITDFNFYVGTHCMVDKNWQRGRLPNGRGVDSHKFYEKYPPEEIREDLYNENEVVGWCYWYGY